MEAITAIPTLILAMLGNPQPSEVVTSMDVVRNEICWASKREAVCFHYSDEGTHLAIKLTAEK